MVSNRRYVILSVCSDATCRKEGQGILRSLNGLVFSADLFKAQVV